MSHDWSSEWTVKDGTHYHVCRRCGQQKDLGTCTAGDWVVTRQAGCTEKGFRYQQCSVCGTRLREEDIQLTHRYGDWKEIQEADCEQEGIIARYCELCGEEDKAVLPSLGHRIYAYDEIVGSCMSEGREGYFACSRCGKLFSDEKGSAEIAEAPVSSGKNLANHVGGSLQFDAEEHWILCACGVKLDKDMHSFDKYGVCGFCGYEDPSKAAEEDPEQSTESGTEKETAKEPTKQETEDTEDPSAGSKAPVPSTEGNGGEEENGGSLWWLWLLLLLFLVAAVLIILRLCRKGRKEEAE